MGLKSTSAPTSHRKAPDSSRRGVMSGHVPSWLVVLMLGMAACGGSSSPNAADPASTSTTATAATSAPSTTRAPEATTTIDSSGTEGEWYGGLLDVGDCFDDTIDADGEYVYTGVPLSVPCDEPHDNEVYAVFQMAEGEYPGSDAFGEQGEELCDEAFTDFVGVDWSVSPLSYLWIWPEEDEWDAGGHEVVCAVYLPDHKIRGTMEDSGMSARPAER